MEHFDFDNIMKVGSLIANLFVAVAANRIKLNVAELKVWVSENFVQRDPK